MCRDPLRDIDATGMHNNIANSRWHNLAYKADEQKLAFRLEELARRISLKTHNVSLVLTSIHSLERPFDLAVE